IADDIHTHPGWAKFLTLADKAGVRSCWSEPVLADAGQVLGTFAVYHREPRTPNEKDVERIQWAASFVRLAIQRKQTQAKLVENERFNRATLDALSAHVAVLDAAGKIVTTNRAWRTFAEANDTPWQTVGEGTNYLAICDRAAAAGDADAAAAARAIRQVLAGEQETWLHQYPCHSADERRWFYCRVTKFPKNGAVHVVVAHENITAMKQAQEQFAAARARFESLDRVSLVGIMFFDCAGKCMDVNERWCEMSSIGREAALGDGRLVAVHPEDRAEVSRRWSQTARAGEGSRSEVRVLRPNGEVAWFLSHTTPTREELGYVTGFVRVCVEITEQKQMEQVHQFLSANVSVLRGTEFFEAVVAKMAELLNCEFCLICRSDAAASEQLVTLAYFADGKIQPNFSYGTAGTPCEHVVDRISCIIPHGVREKFSQDIFLRDHHIESYVGVPFLDSRGRQVGHIAVMSRQPQKHPESIEPIIRFFAVTVVAEMERQTTERRYSDLFELSPDAIVMTDREGVIVEANRQVANVFGWTPAELVGQPVEVLMPANLRAAHPRLRERYLESAVPRAMGSGRSDLLGLRKDGSIFPVDISLSPMETPDGLLIVASVRDVTERQRVQEQLRRSEARYRELFESSRDAVMTPSPQTGRFTSGNPATIHMFGVKDQEHFCTLGPWALSPELQPDGSLSIDKATEQIATAMRDGSQFFEWTHRRIGGELFPATVLLARVELDGQAMLQATVRDISNEKLFLKELQEAAEELKAANAVIEQERAQLAERVAERTAELTAANDELVRASRFKSEFLASMSHELRTPLNGVLGMNELLLKTPLTEQQREFVAASNASGVALLSLINDVLDISKIEAGKLELDPRDCDLEPLAYGVVTMFEHRAREKGVALSCRLAPETCVTVLCDDNRLRQVLVNLIGNALKFTTTGSVMLES
ncbi:MAG: PAS domain S-box protein, partial [Prosthecobacter sp.]|nr:PAS domain S-box protein [Prosthecobacter sp.]